MYSKCELRYTQYRSIYTECFQTMDSFGHVAQHFRTDGYEILYPIHIIHCPKTDFWIRSRCSYTVYKYIRVLSTCSVEIAWT